MKKRTIKITFGQRSSGYKILIGDRLIRVGQWAQKCLKRGSTKIVIVSNPVVYKLYGDVCEQSLRDAGFSVSTYLMKNGEKHKNLKAVDSALTHFAKSGLTRGDTIVALGGGVVGDLAGFAASIYLRGIAYLQIPTTLLAMVDSSVGGKTGVNTPFGKNLLGAFHQPTGVFIDTSTLSTLPERELNAGYYEMVKHGALSSRKLLLETHHFLKEKKNTDVLPLIARNIEFKAQIVAGDEAESLSNTTSKSRKILNFGHTLAHALEKATNYSYFKHGEAVGYGILYAAELSRNLALLDEKDVKLLADVLQHIGPLPRLAKIDKKRVIDALAFDKKNIAGSLQLVLLKAIGKPVIVSASEIPRVLLLNTLKHFFRKWA